MSSVQFNLRIERALLDDIKRAAEERGMPAAEFIREAVVFRIGHLAAQEDAPTTSIGEAGTVTT